MMFIDIEKAYDSLPYDMITLEAKGPHIDMSLVFEICNQSMASIKT